MKERYQSAGVLCRAALLWGTASLWAAALLGGPALLGQGCHDGGVYGAAPAPPSGKSPNAGSSKPVQNAGAPLPPVVSSSPVVGDPPVAATVTLDTARGALAGRLSPAEAELVNALAQVPRITFDPVLDQEDCSKPTGIAVRVGEARQSYVVSECTAAFNEAHFRTRKRVVQEPAAIFVSPVAVEIAGVKHFSLGDKCQELLGSVACASDALSLSWKLLSAVGPIVTFQYFESQSAAGGPPYHGEVWRSIDARTQKRARLDALVSEASLLDALRADTYLHKSLSQKAQTRLNAATTLAEAYSALDTDRATPFIGEFGDYGAFGGFAFISEPPRSGAVPMRIGFREGTFGMAPNRLVTLGLWVKPKPEARRWFENARNGRGVLWSG